MKQTVTIPTQTPPAPRWLNADGKFYWQTDLSFRCQAASADTPAAKKFVNGCAFLRAQNAQNA